MTGKTNITKPTRQRRSNNFETVTDTLIRENSPEDIFIVAEMPDAVCSAFCVFTNSPNDRGLTWCCQSIFPFPYEPVNKTNRRSQLNYMWCSSRTSCPNQRRLGVGPIRRFLHRFRLVFRLSGRFYCASRCCGGYQPPIGQISRFTTWF